MQAQNGLWLYVSHEQPQRQPTLLAVRTHHSTVLSLVVIQLHAGILHISASYHMKSSCSEVNLPITPLSLESYLLSFPCATWKFSQGYLLEENSVHVEV